jgi:hypothetical protein
MHSLLLSQSKFTSFEKALLVHNNKVCGETVGYFLRIGIGGFIERNMRLTVNYIQLVSLTAFVSNSKVI